METEHLIEEKAIHLFITQGFKTTTMDSIATELGMSKKTIYQYFPSKTELIEKCLSTINTQFLDVIQAIVKEGKKAIPEILATHHTIRVNFLNDSSDCFYQLTKYYPKLAEKQKVFYKRKYVRIIEKNIEKGIKEGVYRDDIEVDYVARFFIASLSTIEDLVYFPNDEYTTIEMHSLHLEYHIRSIATEEGFNTYRELIRMYR